LQERATALGFGEILGYWINGKTYYSIGKTGRVMDHETLQKKLKNEKLAFGRLPV
jgi:hypothetical protein